MDTLGLLLAAHVTPANEQERAQVKELAEAVQEVTQQSVQVAFVDQEGNNWGFEYDVLGRLRKVILPDGQVHEKNYDN